jgi:hypothetical protein
MSTWGIVTSISTVLGLVGLIFYIIYKVQEQNSKISLTPEIIKELKKIDLQGVDISSLNKGNLKALIESNNELSNNLINMAIAPEIQNKKRNSLIITILFFLCAISFFVIDFFYDKPDSETSEIHTIALTGLVYLDGKTQEHVSVSLPFYGKSEVTNADGKFIIKDIDTSQAIDIRFIYLKNKIDTIFKLNRGELESSMYFHLVTHIDPPLPLSPTPGKTITGFVRSDQVGIPGVKIRTENGDTATSDNSGNFKIRIKDSSPSLIRISISKDGYRPETRYINPNQSDLVISLEKI